MLASKEAKRGTTKLWPSVDMEYKSRPNEMKVMDKNPASQINQVLHFSFGSLCLEKRNCAIFWKNKPKVVNRDEHTTVKIARAVVPTVCGLVSSAQLEFVLLVPLTVVHTEGIAVGNAFGVVVAVVTTPVEAYPVLACTEVCAFPAEVSTAAKVALNVVAAA